jgi:iron complex transport system permease protein
LRGTRNLLFAAVALMVGIIVAVCGVIGFVGIMAPCLCRLLGGYGHRGLALNSFLCGGVLVASCDMLARTVIFPAEVPIGVVTALIGAPFFLVVLLSGYAAGSRS